MAKTSHPKKQPPLLPNLPINPCAAGIDIGATEMVVAVPSPGPGEAPVRSFGTFTPDLHCLRDWLLACGVTTVAMESTGVYWLPLFDVLRSAGLEVILVNAAQVRHCPARKTDVQDAQWLMQLHTAGLLRGSFHPPEDIGRLRGLMRERVTLVNDASAQVQRMQKALMEMNFQLHHILSDLDGVSGLRMIEAILAGQRDVAALWKLRDARCRASQELAMKALQGNWDEDILSRLRRAHGTWQHLQQQIATIDQRLEALIKGLSAEVPGPAPQGQEAAAAGARAVPAGQRPRRLKKGEIACDVREQGLRLYGVDLTAIPGVSTQTLATLMSEVGGAKTLLSSFKSAKNFASWLGLCPGNRISGGKLLSSKTRRVASRLATALRLSAQALWHSKSHLGDWCRRMKARLGKGEGITATAHRIARLIYELVAKQSAYDDSLIFQLTDKAKSRRLAALNAQAQKLGAQIVMTQQP